MDPRWVRATARASGNGASRLLCRLQLPANPAVPAWQGVPQDQTMRNRRASANGVVVRNPQNSRLRPRPLPRAVATCSLSTRQWATGRGTSATRRRGIAVAFRDGRSPRASVSSKHNRAPARARPRLGPERLSPAGRLPRRGDQPRAPFVAASEPPGAALCGAGSRHQQLPSADCAADPPGPVPRGRCLLAHRAARRGARCQRPPVRRGDGPRRRGADESAPAKLRSREIRRMRLIATEACRAGRKRRQLPRARRCQKPASSSRSSTARPRRGLPCPAARRWSIARQAFGRALRYRRRLLGDRRHPHRR